ncbi:hypothetical protein HO173_008990 [Letharia columbiana]|uniref:Uncharacterized protein n=1 Tax=Letharia columbiana TaxID=112416 RepID=A0A8H6L253_9LECA|nr:uncharacterized protein HO173_008990 [Letharia columbiana]KAF6232776.1 hypothetical protein HO173_008990 [Letharia columbiana]
MLQKWVYKFLISCQGPRKPFMGIGVLYLAQERGSWDEIGFFQICNEQHTTSSGSGSCVCFQKLSLNKDTFPKPPASTIDSRRHSQNLNNTIAEDIESESAHVDSRATVSQSMKEQSRNATDDSLYVYAESRPQKITSKKSVPFRPAKKRLWTSEKETSSSRNDAAKPGDPESATQNYAKSHASSHDGYFPRSVAELQRGINFVVTPQGVCHKPNMSLLYKDFGQRINVMLEWLPDRSLQSPQTVPGDNPSYAADVKIIASFAHSAQEIVQDMNTFRGRSPTSLIDFRPEDFIDALDHRVYLHADLAYEVAQGLYMRIHDLLRLSIDNATMLYNGSDSIFPGRALRIHVSAAIEPAAWGGASTDDLKTKTSDLKAWESMRTPRGGEGPIPFHIWTVPQKAAGPPPVPPGRETNGKATHLRNWSSSDSTDILASFYAGFGTRDDDDIFSRSLPRSTLPKERTVDDSGNRDSDGSSTPRREPDRSAIYQPSPELKQPSMRRSETMPVDLVDRRMRMRPGSLAPLTSSNPNDMKAPSDTSDSSSELHSETTEETYPPPRPNPLQRKPTSGISQDGNGTGHDSIASKKELSNIGASIHGSWS